ncbi:MAG: glutamine--tRNA ligase/YqeY domain fusion protein [Planctomycetota bacterium]
MTTDPAANSTPEDTGTPRHFIQQAIDEDIASGRWGVPGDGSVVQTRFPPEPNGYLHIGHAKAICLNFGLAEEFGGACNLRFDDTNPAKEEQEYVDSITADVRWLGFEPAGGVRFASDYFDRMYAWAEELIQKGLAYVDDQTADEIRAGRGSLKEPGTNSPFRDRDPAESLDLFRRMKTGEFPDGSRVLRAKIDMASPNINLRDPVMYRVLNQPHHRTGDEWHIYPMYDWAHGLEDSIEGVTHSICTLEFEAHRPLYDWFIDAINQDRGPSSKWGEQIHHPQQIEFSRFVLDYTNMSKRYMKQLVDEGRVEGWDDPRMLTVSGLRRRGYTPQSIRELARESGATKFNALTDHAKLENAIRGHLNKVAPRRMCVLDPLKVTLESWPEGEVDWVDAVNNPEDESAGTRKVPFSGTLYIERADFMEEAPKKFFRLKPGGEVRLRYGYWITCKDVIKNDDGEVIELICTHDPETRGGDSPPPNADGKVRKVKGTLHWVSAEHAVPVEVRQFDRLYSAPRPGKKTDNHLDDLNPDSLDVLSGAMAEPALAEVGSDEPSWGDGVRRFQFERHGYFCIDQQRTDAGDRPVFNRTVTLKDSWAKATGGTPKKG